MPRRRRSLADLVAFALATLVTACTVGPDYVRPTAPVPAAYKELGTWKPAEPRDDVARGAWWAVYDDATLARLEDRVAVANQNVAAAEARFRQARALVASARADWWPTVTIGVSVLINSQLAARGDQNWSRVRRFNACWAGSGRGIRVCSPFTRGRRAARPAGRT